MEGLKDRRKGKEAMRGKWGRFPRRKKERSVKWAKKRGKRKREIRRAEENLPQGSAKTGKKIRKKGVGPENFKKRQA